MRRLTHLGLLVFEAIGQRDAGPVFLAGRRVFDGLYVGLGDTPDPDCRLPFLPIHIEADWGDERLDQIGADGREDLPIRAGIVAKVRFGWMRRWVSRLPCSTENSEASRFRPTSSIKLVTRSTV
jgi:hypothetical protein